MNINKIPLIVLITASLAYADDTEIYGTTGADSTRYAKPNVLFITDVSGSMRGSVSHTEIVPFDPSNNYSNSNRIVDNPAYDLNWGWTENSFKSSCDAMKATLTTVGYANINALQYRDSEYQSLKLLTGGDIECYPYEGDTGFKYTLYSADYAKWLNNDANTTVSTRMDVIKEVITDLTRSLTDVKLGLMRFSGSSGVVDVAVEDISTSGGTIRTTVAGYNPNTGTPLTGALYAASNYFRNSSTTPITAECQKNHIILFTDGEPSGDTSYNDDIHDLIEDFDLEGVEPALNKACSNDGGCIEELAYWLRNTDHSTIDGDQYITTHTIGGFNLSAAAGLLGDTATHGQGEFYEADDAPGIAAVVAKIFEGILETDTTFTAPAVSVNAFNSSEHRDDLFYALFRPEDTIKWGGNLKKYKLSTDGVVLHAGGQTINTDTAPAVDLATGYFTPGSYDYWNGTDFPDGSNVTNGGFGKKLNASSRSLYSNTSSDAMASLQSVASYASFGVTNDPTTAFTDTDLYKWVTGYNKNATTSRYSIGDPLHSEPVIMTYGGTDEDPDSTIFFGTNEGFIHAVKTSTGIEQFAFLPNELHDIQASYYADTISAINKPYGMDGPISTWFKDVNHDNVILNSDDSYQTGEHVYLYAGMRRGGRSYYGLNVTNRDSPQLLFRITGGETTGFDRLGQTWSKMTIAKVKWNGTSRSVLFFTGGYDTNQDSNTTRENDSVGNAIYMVDATTGSLLWHTSKDGSNFNISEMKNSIPASISAVDITGDGHVNYFFAADTGGRIFRFDINQTNSTADNFIAGGGVIAQVGGSSASDNLRFYNKPNVALVKDKSAGDYLTISIGSGYRAHPLDDTPNERFYVIKDRNPYNPPSLYTTKTEANSGKTTLADSEKPSSSLLYNATSSMSLASPDSLTRDMRYLLAAGGGFYITLDSEEKVLAESITFSSAIIFTSFLSKNGAENSCGANTGTSKIYTINQKFGTPVIDLDGDGTLDASSTLKHSGIAPRPVVIYREGGGKTIAIGTETIEDKRFEESTPNCEADGTCPADDTVEKCEEGSCYVTPVYWRQNDNE